MPDTPTLRAYVDASGSVAVVCLLVRCGAGPTTTWQWEVPYALWACWGNRTTATWLCQQFQRHDAGLFAAIGTHPLREALRRSLARHRRFHASVWFAASAA